MGLNTNNVRYIIIGIMVSYILKYIVTSIYYNLSERYLRNFSNKDIDTKIYTVKNFLKSISSAVVGVFGAFLLDRMNTAYSMIVLGTIFIILIILTISYMKTRVGLKPEDYSEEERKYDELKKAEKV